MNIQPQTNRPHDTHASREIAGVLFSDNRYPPRLRQPRHAHGPASFSLVLAGGYAESICRTSFDCRPATVVFRPPGEPHAVAFADAPVSIFRLDLAPRWLEGLREAAGVPAPAAAQFAGGPPLWLTLRLRREFASGDQFSALAVEGLTLELLAATGGSLARRAAGRLRRETAEPPRWLERARQMLREELSPAPTVAGVARVVGVHPVHLAHEFRRFYGTGAGEYARRSRVALACRRLARTDLPLSQVAALSGFYDQSHLTNAFRRATGMTPAQYRAALSSS